MEGNLLIAIVVAIELLVIPLLGLYLLTIPNCFR